MSPNHPIVALSHVNVALNGAPVLHDLTWALSRGENWAIFGNNGAGKTTFLRLLRGEIWPAPVNGGVRTYGFDGAPTQSPIGVKKRMALVSAEQQARYARMHEWQLTARDIVFSGFFDSELLWHRPTRAQTKAVDETLELVGIEDIADANFRKLSQGQFRKVLIGRALAAKPDVLVLDEVGVGLDAKSRAHLLELIQRVAERGPQILMTTHRRDELIPAISHVLTLRHGRIEKAERRAHSAAVSRSKAEARFSRLNLANGRNHEAFLVKVENASVALNEGADVVLHDVTWRMNAGEHWLIVGDNGVGKTTLLKLLLGELRPGLGGSIEWFGESHGNVWEVKKRIGFVSADFQARYHADLTAEQVVASGFFASVGWLQPISASQRRRVREALDLLGLRALAKRSILDMSYGQARKVLVARALVNRPRIVILDEVFDGLDPDFRAELSAILNDVSKQAGLILVSHHRADTLACITHRMTLRAGRIEAQERRATMNT